MTIADIPNATAYPVQDDQTDGDISLSNLPSATRVSNANPPVPSPPMVVDGGTPIYEQEKQGAVCCCCCCDFRRAVIIVNSIIIGLSCYTLLITINPGGDATATTTTDVEGYTGSSIVDDDEIQKKIDEAFEDTDLATVIVAGIVMVLAVLPLYGAYKFNLKMVAFGIFLHMSTFIVRFTTSYFLVKRIQGVSDGIDYQQPWILHTVAAIVTAFFIYPHAGLVLEIHQGIMAPETYPREDYSCCCSGVRPSRPIATPVRSYSNTATMNGELPTVPAYR